MTHAPDMDPAEVAAMDVAFAAGVAEAMRRGSCLMMACSHIEGRKVWICLYPPAVTTAHTVVKWAQDSGLAPSDGDLFIDVESVRRAAADLRIA